MSKDFISLFLHVHSAAKSNLFVSLGIRVFGANGIASRQLSRDQSFLDTALYVIRDGTGWRLGAHPLWDISTHRDRRGRMSVRSSRTQHDTRGLIAAEVLSNEEGLPGMASRASANNISALIQGLRSTSYCSMKPYQVR